MGLYTSAIVAADINNDGKADILTTNNNTSALGVLLGNGAGNFTAAPFPSTGANSYPGGLAVVDINKDNKLDAITVNGGNNTVSVLLGNGVGGFLPRTPIAMPTGSFPFAIATADVNGDGNLDVVVANNQLNTVSVLLGNGTGVLTISGSFACGGQPTSVATADSNQDGKIDVLTANPDANTIGVLLGDGMGGFVLSNTPSCGANSFPVRVAAADLNGDGRPDIVTANLFTSTIGVLLNINPLAVRNPLLSQVRPTVFPNPTEGASLLVADNLPAAIYQLKATLTDAIGRTAQHQTLPVSQSAARTTLLTGELPRGLYLLQLTGLNSQGAVVGILPTQRVLVQ